MKAEPTLDQVTSVLRELSTLEWLLIGAALIVAVVLLLVGWSWWRRRRAAAASPGVPPAVEAPARPAVALNKQLAADARRFRRGLPRSARRGLDAFHPVVMLGTESSGKAAIVERFACVAQRRVELGAGAELADGQLRCALGGEAVVFDLSEEVVRAPRSLVDAGLARALGPMLRQRPPVVVVCVSPEVLDKQNEQQLAELGSALRTKIDVLAALRDEPCAVRVVLSDVPGFARFDALFRLLHLPGIPSVLAIDRVDDAAVRETLLGYADDLGTALTELPPHEMLELVGFLELLPQLAGALSMILGELFAPAGELTPRPDGLYLLPAQGGPNPLIVPEGLARPGTSALLKHRLIAFSAALACGAVLVSGYRRDDRTWVRAAAAAASYERKAEHELDLRLVIRAYTGASAGGLRDQLTPRFFVEGPAVVACSFVAQVRQGFLVNRLESLVALPPAQQRPEQALYLAALLYASHDNEIGHLISDRLDEWSSAVGLEVSLVADYTRLARPFHDEHWLVLLGDAAQTSTIDDVEGQLAGFLTMLEPGHAWTAADVVEVGALARLLRPRVRELARFGSAQRIPVTSPLTRLERIYKVHAERFDLLAQLSQHGVGLDRLLAGVLEGVAVKTAAPPRSFGELTAALAPLLTEVAAATASPLVIRGRDYAVDPRGFAQAVRTGEVERIVAGFVALTDADEAQPLFAGAAPWKDVALPIQWPAGTSGAQTHQRAYTREVFDGEVKPAALATSQLQGRLADPGLKAKLAEVLRRSLASYAAGYEAELERLVSLFRVQLSSEVAAQRVLAALAGARSPLRGLVAQVAHDAALGLANDKTGVFDAMVAVEDRFGPLAELFVTGKAGDPFVGYQDVLRDLGARLVSSAPGEKPGGAGDAAPAAPSAAITARLSPAGRLTLALAGGGKDTPRAVLEGWLADQQLSDELASLFRAPVQAVYGLGARDVEAALAAWDRDLDGALEVDLFSRFPFDRQSSDDLDPQILTDWLHPRRGRLATELLPVVTGLVVRARGADGRLRHRPVHACAGDDACVRVPAALLARLDRLSAASELLWDDAGKPRPLEVAITPRPFSVGDGAPLPELVRLTAGETSVFYFNQRPKRTVLSLDWTHDQTSSLSVQLTQSGSLSLTPPAVVVAGTPWSLFRLLQQAERKGATYTWRIRLGTSQQLAVSYDVVDHALLGLASSKTLVWRGRR